MLSSPTGHGLFSQRTTEGPILSSLAIRRLTPCLTTSCTRDRYKGQHLPDVDLLRWADNPLLQRIITLPRQEDGTAMLPIGIAMLFHKRYAPLRLLRDSPMRVRDHPPGSETCLFSHKMCLFLLTIFACTRPREPAKDRLRDLCV